MMAGCTDEPLSKSRNTAAVFNSKGTDPRIYQTGADDPLYRSIGRISCASGDSNENISATAFLVRACYVVTNHHFWRECDSEKKSGVFFQYDLADGKFRGFSLAKIYRKGFDSKVKTKESINDPDWAIYKLSPCADTKIETVSVCADLETKTIATKKFALAGFSADKVDAEGISVDGSCSLYVDETGKFKNFGHDCAARSETSGAPIYYRDGKSRCLIGIHASCYTNSPDNLCEEGIVKQFEHQGTINLGIPSSRFTEVIRSLP